MNELERISNILTLGALLDARSKSHRPSIEEVKQALEIILDDTASYTTSLKWAIDYTRHGWRLAYFNDVGEEALKTQCLYILNNITHWRHPAAKIVRQILKAYSKKG